ncbi:N-acylglucosamine-6-phosphate 2-epimerase [Deinobacterium chartae]|uniref:Putative N-acetylmannosamine-6-phosphate 2-epimerase n=1 Tax=Deinobacterium chartae TaxID=521158 RepID=A0A841I088_9DEIO|nr:N-acetylmannosamine-6-phosphate 2-epimerase [Deinobacterium chartae]MBB6097860.1 N-acylglucosamine-6-phosphate 2-epimerase [Deinobacterium chartae]
MPPESQTANNRSLQTLWPSLEGQLVVSCQADPGSPLRDVRHIVALARAAEAGGARGLRLQSFEDVRAVRAVTALPIIGLTKTDRDDTDVYITPTPEEAAEIARLGAEIVAFDATDRPRPHTVSELVDAIHAAGALAMADISTLEEASAALEAGADVLSTTLSGYTPYSPQIPGPDWELMRALAARGIPFAAEGRIKSPQEAALALQLGAHCVVVGSAITRPDVITSWYARALAEART